MRVGDAAYALLLADAEGQNDDPERPDELDRGLGEQAVGLKGGRRVRAERGGNGRGPASRSEAMAVPSVSPDGRSGHARSRKATTSSAPPSSRDDAVTLVAPEPPARREPSPSGPADWCVDLGDKLLLSSTFDVWTAIARGEVKAATRAWREGLECWTPVEDLPELSCALKFEHSATPAPTTTDVSAPDSLGAYETEAVDRAPEMPPPPSSTPPPSFETGRARRRSRTRVVKHPPRVLSSSARSSPLRPSRLPPSREPFDGDGCFANAGRAPREPRAHAERVSLAALDAAVRDTTPCAPPDSKAAPTAFPSAHRIDAANVDCVDPLVDALKAACRCPTG